MSREYNDLVEYIIEDQKTGEKIRTFVPIDIEGSAGMFIETLAIAMGFDDYNYYPKDITG